MAAGDYRIGLDGTFKYGSAGSTPTTITNNVSGVSLSLNPNAVTVLPRGTGFRGTKVTDLDPELTFTIWNVESDAFRAAIVAAARNKTTLALYPKDASSGEGLDADWTITGLTEGQDNEGLDTFEVTAKIALQRSREPAWR